MNGFEAFWQSLYQPIRIGTQIYGFSIAVILFEFLTPLLLYVLAAFLGTKWFLGYLKKRKVLEERQIRFRKIFANVLRLVFVALVLILGSRFFEFRIVRFFEDVLAIISKPFYKAGATEFSLLTILLAIPVVYLSFLLGRAAKVAFEKSHLSHHRMIEKRRNHIAALVRYTISITVLLLGLSVIGIDFSSIGYFLLVVAAGLILGLYKIIAELFAGMVITLNRVVSEGDYLVVRGAQGTEEGRVVAIRLLGVDLLRASGTRIQVPASLVLHGTIRRNDNSEEATSLVLNFAVASGTDYALVESVATGIAKGNIDCLEEVLPVLHLESLENGQLSFELSIALVAGADLIKVRSNLLKTLYINLAKKNITTV